MGKKTKKLRVAFLKNEQNYETFTYSVKGQSLICFIEVNNPSFIYLNNKYFHLEINTRTIILQGLLHTSIVLRTSFHDIAHFCFMCFDTFETPQIIALKLKNLNNRIFSEFH